jgi:6-pyruvoyl-tetrahydropterin synthase
MEWDVKITVEMDEVGEDNMAIDFKKVSSLLDETDHAIILNEEDPLVEHADILGSVITVSGDPTVEYMTEWMAEKFLELEEVVSVTVSCAETDKYDMEYSA